MSKINTSKIIQFFAYIATGFIAVALLISAIFGNSGTIAAACAHIGQAIAYIVTLIVAGSFVRAQRHIAWLICYVIFAVSIVVFYILGLVM